MRLYNCKCVIDFLKEIGLIATQEYGEILQRLNQTTEGSRIVIPINDGQGCKILQIDICNGIKVFRQNAAFDMAIFKTRNLTVVQLQHCEHKP